MRKGVECYRAASERKCTEREREDERGEPRTLPAVTTGSRNDSCWLNTRDDASSSCIIFRKKNLKRGINDYIIINNMMGASYEANLYETQLPDE